MKSFIQVDESWVNLDYTREIGIEPGISEDGKTFYRIMGSDDERKEFPICFCEFDTRKDAIEFVQYLLDQ